MFGVGLPSKLQQEEDRAQRFIDGEDEGFLAFVYQLLYARGYRIATTPAQVAAWKKKLTP